MPLRQHLVLNLPVININFFKLYTKPSDTSEGFVIFTK
jgi:hypothetical protein